jgi:hypothetical protein
MASWTPYLTTLAAERVAASGMLFATLSPDSSGAAPAHIDRLAPYAGGVD